VETGARGNPRARRTPLEGGCEPSSEVDLTRGGGREPSSEADLTRGGREPLSEADLARGGALLRYLGGPWGPTTVWIVLCACVRLEVSLCFAFSAGFKRDPPGYLGDPYGCPRQVGREEHSEVGGVRRRRTSEGRGAPRHERRMQMEGRGWKERRRSKEEISVGPTYKCVDECFECG
jgi:hypothetical protein